MITQNHGETAPRTVAVIGLGYAGLPVVVAFARRFPGTIGFDRDVEKVGRLRAGLDPTGVVSPDALRLAEVAWTTEPADLAAASFYVIAVPTPIDDERRPDLADLEAAAETLGGVLARGDIVVLESTVYPGVTEEVLGPLLANASGLEPGVDFALGYSPERINAGDREHSFESVTKVVSAQDPETLAVLVAHYGEIVESGLFEAASIRVAEAAEVIENVQRDLNIALVNELSRLFEHMGVDTRAVLETAGSKWNFHAYRPGLVGGHCIGVDPYYLTSKAQSIGFDPEVILAGRRTNDNMGTYVAARIVKLLVERGGSVKDARVAVLGLTFKPDVADLRNSQVPVVVRELIAFGIDVLVHDPLVSATEAERACGFAPTAPDELVALDAVVLAVPHRGLTEFALDRVRAGAGLLIDLMWAVDNRTVASLGDHVRFWRL